MDKQTARNTAKKYRAGLDAEFVERASAEITHQLQEAVNWSEVNSVNVYQQIHTNNEASTDSLISWLEEMHPNIRLHKQSVQPIFPTDSFDVIIVPCLAMDISGVRVGYGGGNYDKYLADHESAQIIALCFEEQVFEQIESEPHDIRPTMLVTEEQIRFFD